jgi:polyisoprenoid-binding protein YceI
MTTATEQLPAGTYALDPVHSTIGFGVKYNGLATFRSSFGAVEASYENGVLTGKARVDSIDIDVPDFKNHLLSPDFFDAENHPELTFRSTAIRPSADGKVEVDGELTIRGVTKPVTATGTWGATTDAFGNERVGFVLSTTVDRREFGVSWQNQLPNGNDAVDWNVTIEVDLQLVKQA